MAETTIIVPCAGRSSRYPNLRPKFLLVNPNGNLMIIDALSKINAKGCQVVVTVLAKHEETYKIGAMFRKFFPELGIKLCVLDKETKSQSETVYQTLKKMRIEGPFLVKDPDNVFRLDSVPETYNYVSVEKLDNAGLVNASNKSYVQVDSSGLITSIEEKKVISNLFSVGGYFFTSPADFITAFDEISGITEKEVYISTVINHLVFKKKLKFKVKHVAEYVDLGTIEEWVLYKEKTRTYFIDIDGILVKNSGEYFEPYWGTTDAIRENVDTVNRLFDAGSQVILTTSRKEPFRAATEKQLKKFGIRYHQLVMGLYHSRRVLINDFTGSNPYPSAIAISIPRDSNELEKYLH